MDKRPESTSTEQAFANQIGDKAERKLKARRNPTPGVWFGLGMMGTIGWAIAVPTLLGVAVGIWLDSRFPGRHPWTLALMMAGLVLGCGTAWHWVTTEHKAMQEEDDA